MEDENKIIDTPEEAEIAEPIEASVPEQPIEEVEEISAEPLDEEISEILMEQDLLDGDASAAPEKSYSKTMVVLWGVIGVLAVALVALLGIMLFGGKGAKEWKGLKLGENYSKNVTLGDYSALTYTDTYVEPDEAAVIEEIHKKMTDHKSEDKTDQPIEKGDVVNIDFEGFINEERNDNACSTGYDLTIGSGSFIPGFEDGLIGHKAGEKVTLNIAFPDPYKNNPDLAGQPVRFEVTINSVTRTTYEEITARLVNELTDGEYTTVDSYKGYIKASLQDSRRQAADNAAREELWQEVMDGAELHKYPQEMYDYFVAILDEQYASYYAQYGVENLEGFMEYNKLNLKDHIENQIKYEYAIYIIADQQDIEITDEDVQTLLDQYGYESKEALVEAMNMSTFELDEYILYQKTSAYLLTTATKK